jgi:hypothetical protein
MFAKSLNRAISIAKQVTQANDAAEVVGTAMTDLEERCRRAEASARSSAALELELRTQVRKRFMPRDSERLG